LQNVPGYFSIQLNTCKMCQGIFRFNSIPAKCVRGFFDLTQILQFVTKGT
jgi:hypothetical protein